MNGPRTHTCTQGSQLSGLRQERKAMAGSSVPARRVSRIIPALSATRNGPATALHALTDCPAVSWALLSFLPCACPTTITVFKAALGEEQEEVRVATVAFWTFVSLIFITPVSGGEVRKRRKTPANQWLEQQQEEAGRSPS